MSTVLIKFEDINLENFKSKIKKVSSGCFEWVGLVGKNGYGRMSVSNKMRLAHRVSYVVHFGSVPAGKLVCHTCDNPPCVNPEHLFLGTQSENLNDAAKKGRLGLSLKGKPNWRRGITKYEKVIDGQGVVLHSCAKCNKDVYRKITDKCVSGKRFCNLSCKTSYFNSLRFKK